jgi:hypothetical protein
VRTGVAHWQHLHGSRAWRTLSIWMKETCKAAGSREAVAAEALRAGAGTSSGTRAINQVVPLLCRMLQPRSAKSSRQ